MRMWTGWPSQKISPVVRLIHAGDALGQDRLAGAVVSAEGGDLAGRKVEIDSEKGLDGTEVLADSPRSLKRSAFLPALDPVASICGHVAASLGHDCQRRRDERGSPLAPQAAACARRHGS